MHNHINTLTYINAPKMELISLNSTYFPAFYNIQFTKIQTQTVVLCPQDLSEPRMVKIWPHDRVRWINLGWSKSDRMINHRCSIYDPLIDVRWSKYDRKINKGYSKYDCCINFRYSKYDRRSTTDIQNMTTDQPQILKYMPHNHPTMSPNYFYDF